MGRRFESCRAHQVFNPLDIGTFAIWVRPPAFSGRLVLSFTSSAVCPACWATPCFELSVAFEDELQGYAGDEVQLVFAQELA